MKPYLLLPALLLLAACKPCDDPANPECPNYCADPANPKCPNYDPCLGKTPVSAEFVIEELIYGRRSTRMVTDTLLEYMLLTGPEGASRYEWHVGTDARVFTTREVFLSFSFSDTNTTVPITLVVESMPDTACFPDDNGLDTVRKSVYVSAPRHARIVGRYRGVRRSNPADTFDIGISYKIDFTGVTSFDLWRLPQTCQDTPHVEAMWIAGGYYGLYVDAGFEFQCHKIAGTGRLKPDDRDSLIFPFTNTQSPPDVFRGKRMKP
ncbi:MAG: hypothetical protein NW241_00870 [Bacteroidia bacterium]|nr:hypothetical protein [Bacteroidia bacterium]